MTTTTPKLGRKRTGNIERRKGKPVYIRVILPTGELKRIPLPRGCSEAMAEEKRRFWTEKAESGELQADPAVEAAKPVPDRVGGEETVSAWFGRWCTLRREKGLRAVSDDESAYKMHIGPKLGRKAMARFDAADVEDVRDALDGKIRERLAWETAGCETKGRVDGRKPGIAPKTAANAWGILVTMCRDASRSKQRDLRVRADNPAINIEGPDAHEDKAGQFLYPSEFLQLMRCTAVPLRFRRLVALATYTYTRQGELRARRWRDVDLEHRRIAITTSIDRKTGNVSTTKTSSARTPEIEPNLVPLLEALEDEPGEPVTWMPPEEAGAVLLRKYLHLAGVTRAELHTDTKTTRKLNFHDLRHTACTWAAARGDSAFAIMAKSGHLNLATVNGYCERFGEVNKATFGEAFPPIPGELLVVESATDICHDPSRRGAFPAGFRRSVVTPTGIEPVLPA